MRGDRSVTAVLRVAGQDRGSFSVGGYGVSVLGLINPAASTERRGVYSRLIALLALVSLLTGCISIPNPPPKCSKKVIHEPLATLEETTCYYPLGDSTVVWRKIR